MKEKLHHKALDHSDDVGAVTAALLGLAGIFHIPEKLGITVDELAMALGFSFTILAFMRGRLEKRRRVTATPTASAAPATAEESDLASTDPPASSPEA